MATRKTDAGERRNYQKLERRLVLLAWLNGKFGSRENKGLLDTLVAAVVLGMRCPSQRNLPPLRSDPEKVIEH